jgi:hypothetical protein
VLLSLSNLESNITFCRNESISEADYASDDHSAYSNKMKIEAYDVGINKGADEKLVLCLILSEIAVNQFQGEKRQSTSVILR